MMGSSFHTRNIVRATMEGVRHMAREVWDRLNCMGILLGGLAKNDNICQVGGHQVGHQAGEAHHAGDCHPGNDQAQGVTVWNG